MILIYYCKSINVPQCSYLQQFVFWNDVEALLSRDYSEISVRDRPTWQTFCRVEVVDILFLEI